MKIEPQLTNFWVGQTVTALLVSTVVDLLHVNADQCSVVGSSFSDVKYKTLESKLFSVLEDHLVGL